MKGLVWGEVGVGSLETTKPKLVMAGIQQRGQWDVIRFGRDEWEFEIQVIKDSMVDGCEPVKLELCSLSLEPFEQDDLVVVEIGSLEDIEVPLSLLCVSWQVIDVAGNGGLSQGM